MRVPRSRRSSGARPKRTTNDCERKPPGLECHRPSSVANLERAPGNPRARIVEHSPAEHQRFVRYRGVHRVLTLRIVAKILQDQASAMADDSYPSQHDTMVASWVWPERKMDWCLVQPRSFRAASTWARRESASRGRRAVRDRESSISATVGSVNGTAHGRDSTSHDLGGQRHSRRLAPRDRLGIVDIVSVPSRSESQHLGRSEFHYLRSWRNTR